jgi:hypothetical protein
VAEAYLPDVFNQFLAFFSSILLAYYTLDPAFVSFVACFITLPQNVVCCQSYIAEWAVQLVSFFDYVSVGGPGIPRSEAEYDHLFFSAEFGRVILPAC